MMYSKHFSSDSRQGIALVIVLGFLSIILLLAVAFVITLRTERLATRNYVDVVKARYLMQTGLARAVDAVDQYLDKPGPGGWFYMGMDDPIFYSLNTPSVVNCRDLLTGEATNFIPRSLWSQAVAGSQSVVWTNIFDGTNLVGRFAYLIVDCSGLLDANSIGGLTHSNGTQAGEISIAPAVLPEINSSPNFLAMRTSKVRFETIPELWQLGNAAGAIVSRPKTLFTYSYYPANQFATGFPLQLTQAVYIGGDEARVINTQSAIQVQFQAMGLSAADAQVASWNVVDYLDTDLNPANGKGLNNFCTEPVPMLNEVVVSNRVTASTNSTTTYYTNRLSVGVEVWYPFVGYVNSNAYDISLRLRTSGGNFPFLINPAVRYPLGGGLWNDVNQRFRLVSVNLPDISYSVINGGPVAFPTYRLEVSVVDPGGAAVDQIANPVDVPALVSVLVVPADSNVVFDKQADDPRINWNWSDPVHWRQFYATNTLGTTNVALTYTNAGADGVWEMYVRNAPELQNVGELGFLLYSATRPWRTIRLLDPGSLPVLDRFTTTTNNYRKGLVNLNSRFTNSLMAALVDVPAERWPGAPLSVTTTMAQAASLAEAITNTSVRGLYTNVSEIAKITDDVFTNSLAFDQSQAEGIIRNVAGLLSPRQNLFTIILAAQSVDDVNRNNSVTDDEVRAEQRAVVIVWRDPYPDSSGRHPTFVRLFKWLTN